MRKPKSFARPLAERIARARQEGRSQHALELARQLYKQEPTEAHRELVRQVTLERGLELQQMGHFRDAATVYVNARSLAGSPEFDATLATRLAACGKLAEALPLLGPAVDPKVRLRVLGQAADHAVQEQHAPSVPAELQPQLELVVRAFSASHAGRDEEAREALQGIGLQSPFLEWKVFLRGLLAYYAGDNARALENWQRLDPQRLPARLTAPFKFRLDPAYQAAQPPETQRFLAERSARLVGTPLLEGLEGLKDKLLQENLGPAFRQAEQMLPALKRDFPALVPRLARCFYWAIINQGSPDDLDRYLRVFGAPADDQNLDRLQALAMEVRGMLGEAHRAWQDYIKTVAGAPKVWPPEQARRVQALVWARMGDNAMPGTRRGRMPQFDIFNIFGPPPEPHLKPSAEECYRQSVTLVPERLESQLALFNLYRENDQTAKAKKVGQELLKRFPDHTATLEALGDLALESKDLKKAQEYFERALAANPLERRLRSKLARAHQNRALELTLDEKFAEARAQYEATLALWDGPKGAALCQMAVLEMKAGETARAGELVARALAEPDQRLASRYTLLGEAVRAKLPPARRKELAAAYDTELKQAPTPAETLMLLETAARQRVERLDAFHGQKTREKNLVKFLERLPLDTFDERQLERLAASLALLDARGPMQRCLREAETRFPDNPTFRLLLVEYHLTSRSPESHGFEMKMHLEHARKLAEKMPRGEQQQQLLETIKQKDVQVQEICGTGLDMFGMFNPFMDEMFYEDEDEFYEDDE